MMLSVEKLDVHLGPYPILDQISFEQEGGVLGLCGPNGSGKSTLIRTLAGIQEIKSGHVEICGKDLKGDYVEARRCLGYLPEYPELYPFLSCRDICETAAFLRGASLEEFEERLQVLGLGGKEDNRLSTMSAGQQRKVTLLAALAGSPSVLLLDEPTKTLDIQARNFLSSIIKRWKEEGKLVVIASHLFAYLEETCSSFLFLSQGKSVAFGSLEEIREQVDKPNATLDEVATSLMS